MHFITFLWPTLLEVRLSAVKAAVLPSQLDKSDTKDCTSSSSFSSSSISSFFFKISPTYIRYLFLKGDVDAEIDLCALRSNSQELLTPTSSSIHLVQQWPTSSRADQSNTFTMNVCTSSSIRMVQQWLTSSRADQSSTFTMNVCTCNRKNIKSGSSNCLAPNTHQSPIYIVACRLPVGKGCCMLSCLCPFVVKGQNVPDWAARTFLRADEVVAFKGAHVGQGCNVCPRPLKGCLQFAHVRITR